MTILRRTVHVLWPVAIVACGDATLDLTSPTSSARSEQPFSESETDVSLAELFDAAWEDLGDSARLNTTVGVPRATRNERTAIVRFISAAGSEEYRYVRGRQGWDRAGLVVAGDSKSPQTQLGGVTVQSAGYPGKIATIKKANGTTIDWYHDGGDAVSTDYQRYFERDLWDPSDAAVRAEFFPGANSSNGVTYSVSLLEWYYSTQAGGDYCSTEVCRTVFTDLYQNEHDADMVRLWYDFVRVGDVTVGIEGPSSLGWKEPTTWTSEVSGGDGRNYAYSWEKNSGGGWMAVGSSEDLTLTPANGDAFTLRLTVTSAGRVETSNSISVQARNPLYDPVVAQPITGPAVLVGAAGSFTWETGDATGGSGSYAYEWSRMDPNEYGQYVQWNPVGAGQTLTLNISNCDEHFRLRMRVVGNTPDYGSRESSSEFEVENYTSGGDMCW